MRKKNSKKMIVTSILCVLFIALTIALSCIDVRPIGPRGSKVGLATLNEKIHNLLGVHMELYNITDYLSIIAGLIVFGFAVLGLVQLIKRRSLFKVDRSIILLGGFYVVVLMTYLFFEHFIVNYRPVLIENVLEASYPSSTTMLVLCVMVTAMMQFKRRIKMSKIRIAVNIVCGIFTAAMVIGRMLSGVHWFTDIMAGAILSTLLIMIYDNFDHYLEHRYN